jgi:hypothetical protein
MHGRQGFASVAGRSIQSLDTRESIRVFGFLRRVLVVEGKTQSSMTGPWLLPRYGHVISSPSASQIADAAQELFDESSRDMTEAAYEAHGVACLGFGSDKGPMYVLEISRAGVARFEQWTDHACEIALAPAAELSAIGEARSVELWSLLAGGDVDSIRSVFASADIPRAGV